METQKNCYVDVSSDLVFTVVFVFQPCKKRRTMQQKDREHKVSRIVN